MRNEVEPKTDAPMDEVVGIEGEKLVKSNISLCTIDRV
jgi:hypothetical protein